METGREVAISYTISKDVARVNDGIGDAPDECLDRRSATSGTRDRTSRQTEPRSS